MARIRQRLVAFRLHCMLVTVALAGVTIPHHAWLAAAATQAGVVAADGDVTLTKTNVGASEELPPAPTPPPQQPPRAFEFAMPNETVTLADGSWSATVARGALAWPNVNAATPPATFSVIQSLISKQEVADILSIVRDSGIQFDQDADSVDAMATHEFYLESAGGFKPLTSIKGKPDTDASTFKARQPYRDRLAAITRPIMEARVVPFVNQNIPACGGRAQAVPGANVAANASYMAVGSSAVGNARDGVGCSVCQSLVRRYRDGERLTHATHFDVQALVTVVVALSSYDVEFTGGLFLTTGSTAAGGSGDVYVAMQAGNAAVHQSDLLHGVRVFPPPTTDAGPMSGNSASPTSSLGAKPERWSWIMWFKDGKDCEHAAVREWALEGAEHGNAVAQFLQARRSGTTEEKLHWLRQSATNGLARAANELAMHLLGNNPGKLQGENATAVEEGEQFLRLAAERGEPDALYNLGMRSLARSDEASAIDFFLRAASAGSTEAAFNMGVAAYNGKGVRKDLDVASRWFERAGTAHAAYLVAKIASAGTAATPADAAKSAAWLQRSAKGGYLEACLELAQSALKAVRTVDTDREANVMQAQAVEWLRCAARAGHSGAVQVLRQLNEE